MKKTKLLIVSLLFGMISYSQTLPHCILKSPTGENSSTDSIQTNKSYLMLIFCKTAEKRCCSSVMELDEELGKNETAEKMDALLICEDCIGKHDHLLLYKNCMLQNIDLLIDVNGDLKRMMGINSFPTFVLFDQKMNEIGRSVAFAPQVK